MFLPDRFVAPPRRIDPTAWGVRVLCIALLASCNHQNPPRESTHSAGYPSQDSQAIANRARHALNDARRRYAEPVVDTLQVSLFRYSPGEYAIVQFQVDTQSRSGSIVKLIFPQRGKDTVVAILDSILPLPPCNPVPHLVMPGSDSARIVGIAVEAYRKGPTGNGEYECAHLVVEKFVRKADGTIEIRLGQQERTVRSGGAIVLVSSRGIPRVVTWLNW